MNIDYGGWSKQTIVGRAWAVQPSPLDSVKAIVADLDSPIVYWYDTENSDLGTIYNLTYQSGYRDLNTPPRYRKTARYATIETGVDSGEVYHYWYKDYGTLIYSDSVVMDGENMYELLLPDTLRGKNLSMKVVTGDSINEITFSRYWWEYIIDTNRK
jgi:hypothetical protein